MKNLFTPEMEEATGTSPEEARELLTSICFDLALFYAESDYRSELKKDRLGFIQTLAASL